MPHARNHRNGPEPHGRNAPIMGEPTEGDALTRDFLTQGGALTRNYPTEAGTMLHELHNATHNDTIPHDTNYLTTIFKSPDLF